MTSLSTTSSPATAALENLLGNGSNKRVKRSTMDSPNASFSFDMSELFLQTSEESFPSIEWSFDGEDDDDNKSVSSTCTNSSTASLSESSLGKRSRNTSGGLSRSKTLRSSIDLLG